MSSPSSVQQKSSKKFVKQESAPPEEEEEEESIFKLYPGNNDFSSDSDEDNQPKYTPPYEVVINNLMPFGRPNLRGLLSYGEDDEPNKKQFISQNSVQNFVEKKKFSRKTNDALSTTDFSVKVKTRVLNVSETIYYATLNHSTPEVIPIFAHTVVQKCVQINPVQAYQCHPHFDTMPNSSKT